MMLTIGQPGLPSPQFITNRYSIFNIQHYITMILLSICHKQIITHQTQNIYTQWSWNWYFCICISLFIANNIIAFVYLYIMIECNALQDIWHSLLSKICFQSLLYKSRTLWATSLQIHLCRFNVSYLYIPILHHLWNRIVWIQYYLLKIESCKMFNLKSAREIPCDHIVDSW